jgi:hypothetical protein
MAHHEGYPAIQVRVSIVSNAVSTGVAASGRGFELYTHTGVTFGAGSSTDVPPRFRRFSPENSRITYFMA